MRRLDLLHQNLNPASRIALKPEVWKTRCLNGAVQARTYRMIKAGAHIHTMRFANLTQKLQSLFEPDAI